LTPTIPASEIFKCSFGQAIKLITINYYMWKSDIEIIQEEENLLEIILRYEVLPIDKNSRAIIEATYQYQARI
jgi:hypothetical protein